MTEKEILVELYNTCGGDQWQDKDGWCSNLPLNKWSGVKTDENGWVIILQLWGNNLIGNLPECIGRLIKLKELSLYGNSLTGRIPSTFENLLQLERFDTHYTQIRDGWEHLATLTELNGLYIDGDLIEYLQLPPEYKTKSTQEQFIGYLTKKLDEYFSAIQNKKRDINQRDIVS